MKVKVMTSRTPALRSVVAEGAVDAGEEAKARERKKKKLKKLNNNNSLKNISNNLIGQKIVTEATAAPVRTTEVAIEVIVAIVVIVETEAKEVIDLEEIAEEVVKIVVAEEDSVVAVEIIEAIAEEVETVVNNPNKIILLTHPKRRRIELFNV